MNLKRLVTLLLALSLLIGGVMPVFAAEAPAALVSVQQAGPDLISAYLANLPEGWGVVTADNLAVELVENAPFLLDVREANEGQEDGYILNTNASIPLRELAQNLNLLPGLDDPIVVYCKSGHRGAIAMTVLQMLGYTNVRNLAGGFTGWVGAEFEVVAEFEAVAEGEAPALDEALLADINTYLAEELPQGWGVVSANDLALELVENAPFLLDVREPGELAEVGYIEGAYAAPLRELGSHLDALPTDQPIVVYCKSGHRGAIAMTALQILGYEVRNLAGGITGWISAGFETVGAAEVVEAEDTFDLGAYASDYLANLPQGWGVVAADALLTEIIENPPFLLDVREANEGQEDGYILNTNASIPLRELAQNLNLLPGLDDPVVVYCKSGHRGAIAMTVLQMLGYTNVRNLAGGFTGWVGAEFEVVAEFEAAEAGAAPEISADLVTTMDNYLTAVLPEGWGVVSANDLALELVENAPFLLDVREPGELAEVGYIEGAYAAPLRELGSHLDALPTDQPIVVYCKSGHRGAIAMTALQILGYEVRNLAGGITGWTTAGYETVGATAAEAAVEVALPEGEPLSAEALEPLVLAYVTDMPQGFRSLSAANVNDLLGQQPFLLDVREASEIQENGYIEGAVHIPERDLMQYLDVLPTDQQIIVYCASGHRGAIATMALGMMGYDAVNLRGGFRAWAAGEFPVASGAPAIPARADFPEVDAALWVTLNDYMVSLPDGFYTIAPADVNTQIIEGSAPVLIDVREASEYEGGFIEGAVSMPMRSFADYVDELPAADEAIVVYDSSGHRSGMVMMGLQLLGYENTLSMPAGSEGWAANGFALVTE